MSMITPAARQSFEHLLCAALRTNIGVQQSDHVEVRATNATPGKAEAKRTLVLLTCASLRFKLVVIFQVVDEALARAYFCNDAAACDPIEVLFERGNLSCGAINRELLSYVPHVGLSTPSMLSSQLSKVLATFAAEHVSHFAVHVNGDHLLDVALCMHGRATVDFMANTQVAIAETGELELF